MEMILFVNCFCVLKVYRLFVIKRAIDVLLAYSFKNIIYSGEDNLKVIFFFFNAILLYRDIDLSDTVKAIGENPA